MSSDSVFHVSHPAIVSNTIDLNTLPPPTWSADDSVRLFEAIQLDATVRKSLAAKSNKITPLLLRICFECHLHEQPTACTRAHGLLLYHLATRLNPDAPLYQRRDLIYRAIFQSQLRTTVQIEAAAEFLDRKPQEFANDSSLVTAFNASCGIGIAYTLTQIQQAVADVIRDKHSVLLAEQYRAAPAVYSAVNKTLPWGDGKLIKQEIDAQLLSLLGPKQEYKKGAAAAAPSPAPSTASVPSKAVSNLSSSSPNFLSLPFAANDIAAVQEWLSSISGRDIQVATNTSAQLEAHLRVVPQGCVRSRFPPEPNGYLHLGHAKAMNFNFGLATLTGGQCIMRFDDTNPEAEKEDYIQSILENLEWLGHKPSTITYSSDYFSSLFELACKLIDAGLAYVDHQTAAEMKASRDLKRSGMQPIPSPWRVRPKEESLKLFHRMRQGRFAEGAATLRLKGDLNHSNPQMWDIVAYRIKFAPHPHVGQQWCIYPSYDFTHCIVDSLEHITHSCCTLEFEVRRESYYWLLNALDLYKPKVWEYSRLNVEYNVMSKRRLLRLVTENHVNGWDDPRLLTINGLRRRGYSPRAIRDFCNSVGISRNETMIPMDKLEYWCRQDLELTAFRAMCVVQPVKVILDNWDEHNVEQLPVPNIPKVLSCGSHEVPLTKIIYLDRADIRLVDEKNFFGLSPGKEVHLKYAYNITATRFVMSPVDPSEIECIHATVDLTNANKPKGKLQWVAQPRVGVSPLHVELRLYENLFCSADPMSLDDWIADLNPKSLRIVPNAHIDPSVLTRCKPGDTYQFERLAFFVVDPDSTAQKLVFNRITELRG